MNPAPVFPGFPSRTELNMRFSFLMSDPDGDLELSEKELRQPFLISPEKQHAYLTLEDYFGALQEFILSDNSDLLRAALHRRNPPDNRGMADVSEVSIRSEKHGAFYHIASVVLRCPDAHVKLAVTTALSKSARKSLLKEMSILQNLAALNPEFLPHIYGSKTVTWRTASGAQEFFMVLEEWLEGYHEWHLCTDPASREQKIRLWDYEKGYRFLSRAESYELLRQGAYILTSYYDQATFRQIYPWHHAAGDFVVRADSGSISVKLISARQYDPLIYFDRAGKADRLVAAIHLLLNLSLRIRLDRSDGVGEPMWLADYAVAAAIDGFFAALHDSGAAGRSLLGSLEEFLEILLVFDVPEIIAMYGPLLEIYDSEDQNDLRLIREKLPEHALKLHEALRSISLEKL